MTSLPSLNDRSIAAKTGRGNVVRLGPLAGLQLAAKFWWDPIRCMDSYHRRLGRAIAVKRPDGFPIKYLFLVGPDYNQRVLTRTDIVRPSGLWELEGTAGSALNDFQHDYLTTFGKEHEAVSAQVAPHLRRSRTSVHFQLVKTIVLEETNGWPVKTPVDLYARIRKVAQRAAFTALFGEEDVGRISAFGGDLAAFHQSSWSSLAHAVPFNVPGLPYRRAARQAESLKSFIVSWVKEQRGIPRNRNLRAALANMRDPWAGRHLPDGRIAGYVIFLAFASFETMSSALSWTLFLLAQHPKTAADLTDELKAKQPVEEADQQAVAALPLLDAVIKEALRLYPPTPYLPLRTYGDWELDGVPLRSGSHVILSPRLTHRLPELYAEPERFLPERWSSIKPSAYEYLPFSGGPRRCPGQPFGTDFLKIALAVILSRYRLRIAPSGRVGWDFTGIMMPKSNIPVVLSPA